MDPDLFQKVFPKPSDLKMTMPELRQVVCNTVNVNYTKLYEELPTLMPELFTYIAKVSASYNPYAAGG